jgi:homoserine O-acetyltransferase/O-succinyltransferase
MATAPTATAPTATAPTATAPPVTGAWRPGDPVGHRQFLTIADRRPLVLENGGLLRSVQVAYETWGSLDATASNAVLLCHAWTGDSHVIGPSGHGHASPGWWEGVVGAGLAIDTDRYFVVCANVLGGCQGSTGPSSPHPDDGRAYGSRFPLVTIRDMVRVQASLTDHLGIPQWLSVIGGSMGGMQVLEWGITYPSRVRSLSVIAACAQSSAQQIALGSVGRRAIKLDPNWNGGDYYDAEPGQGPHGGLTVARQLAQITFRSDEVFTTRFGRELADQQDRRTMWQRFEVERYLDYHGDKLVRRFDANSYVTIGKAMELHDVGRGRGGLDAALARIGVPLRAIGIASDVLYPNAQQRTLVADLCRLDRTADYIEIDSPDGHDAFLIAVDQVSAAIGPFIDKVHKG